MSDPLLHARMKRDAARKHSQSKHAKKVSRRYRESEKGIEVRRRAVAKYAMNNPRVIRAQQIVHVLSRNGTLVRPSNCECHHWDYDCPLNIRWLGKKKHAERHAWCRRFKEYYESL